MKYISVTSPGTDMSKPIFNYFNDYLVSLGEPTTSPGWDHRSLRNHFLKMIHEKPSDVNLYVDSGGFQIIVDDIIPSRIGAYIDIYHDLCDELCDKYDNIFSLDIFNRNLSGQDLYDFNKYSIQKSIDLIIKKPQFADKQLFVLQSSNKYSFGNWKKLMTELNVQNYYKKWAVGGLVGLKKNTNAKFSHAVPATLWLLTYKAKYGMTIDQVHWLGQSSRLSFISMALMERLFGLNMTSDSSQLVRFAALEHKFPFMFQHHLTKEFSLVNSVNDVFDKMLFQHSLGIDFKHKFVKKGVDEDKSNPRYDYYSPKEYYDNYALISGIKGAKSQLHNVDFIECQSQNVYFDMQFAEMIADMIIEVGLENIHTSDQLLLLHPLMKQGRIAVELFNNILYIKKFAPLIISGDLDKASEILDRIHEQYEYYTNNKNQSDTDKKLNELTSLVDTYQEQLDIVKFQLAEYDNDEFAAKLQYLANYNSSLEAFDKYFTQANQFKLDVKSAINSIKNSDKRQNQSYVNSQTHEQNELFMSNEFKGDLVKFEKYLRSINKDKFVSTDIKHLEQQLKKIESEIKTNKNLKDTIKPLPFDEDLNEYNMLKEHYYTLDLKLHKVLSEVQELTK